MHNLSRIQVVLLIVAILLSACGYSSEVQVNETSNDMLSYDETVHMNNCGGKGDTLYSASRSFTRSIGGEFEVGIQQGIDIGIMARYGQYQNETKSMLLTAPSGTDMIFVLHWSERVIAGNVSHRGSSGTYEVSIPISVELVSAIDQICPGTPITQPTAISSTEIVTPPTSAPPPVIFQGDQPFRVHQTTPVVGTGVLMTGTYSDGMAQFSEADTRSHSNIQRIRLEENPDGCAISNYTVDKIWLGSSVRTNLTINGSVVGMINGPTGKHGYIFNVGVNAGDIICVTYYEPSGFQIIFGPDLYYHYDSYCYRGNCN